MGTCDECDIIYSRLMHLLADFRSFFAGATRSSSSAAADFFCLPYSGRPMMVRSVPDPRMTAEFKINFAAGWHGPTDRNHCQAGLLISLDFCMDALLAALMHVMHRGKR